jgi:hypothetical protein
MQATIQSIRSHFQRQAEACERLGSPFTAAVLTALDDALAGGRRPSLRWWAMRATRKPEH